MGGTTIEHELMYGAVIVNGRKFETDHISKVVYDLVDMSAMGFLRKVGGPVQTQDRDAFEHELTLYVDRPNDRYLRVRAPAGLWSVEAFWRRVKRENVA